MISIGLFLHMAPNMPMAAMIMMANPTMMRMAEPPITVLPVTNEKDMPTTMAHIPIATATIPRICGEKVNGFRLDLHVLVSR